MCACNHTSEANFQDIYHPAELYFGSKCESFQKQFYQMEIYQWSIACVWLKAARVKQESGARLIHALQQHKNKAKHFSISSLTRFES